MAARGTKTRGIGRYCGGIWKYSCGHARTAARKNDTDSREAAARYREYMQGGRLKWLFLGFSDPAMMSFKGRHLVSFPLWALEHCCIPCRRYLHDEQLEDRWRLVVTTKQRDTRESHFATQEKWGYQQNTPSLVRCGRLGFGCVWSAVQR